MGSFCKAAARAWILVLGGWVMAGPGAWAQEAARDHRPSSGAAAGAGVREPLGAAALRGWLASVQQAAQRLDYQGTLVTTTPQGVSTARMVHWSNGGQPIERLEMLDGEPRIAVRRQDTVQVLWPQRRLVTVEQRDPLAVFPALPQADADEMLRWYEAAWVGSDRVAGLEARVLMLRPRDALRFTQLLWTERDSGLLLRAQVVAADGQVLESVGFTEIALAVRGQPESALQALKVPDGWRVWRPAVQRTALDAEGWSLRQAVAGFRPTLCIRRPLESAAAAARHAVQAIFSDGLTHVSVFIEPASTEPGPVVARESGAVSALGATHSLSLQRADARLTVVGDVPAATLRQFLASLERRR